VLSVAEARARVIAGLRPTATEVVALSEAWGRVTAMPLQARLTQPPTDVSAMDGYALRAEDGAVGAWLRVAGRAPAGHPFMGRVGAGEAVRLYTGSAVPDGADCVVVQEDVTVDDARDGAGDDARGGAGITLLAAARPGRHIRRKGGDFAQGTHLVPAGTRLGARAVGLAAAGNHPWVSVHRRPRIALLATGDEIALPGDPLGPGGIVSSNVHALAALVRAGGGEPMMLPIARDTVGAVAQAIQGVAGLDMLVTTGGASVGDYDLVQAGLAQHGFTLDFWRIAMRPGKPHPARPAGAGPAGQSGVGPGVRGFVPLAGALQAVRAAWRGLAVRADAAWHRCRGQRPPGGLPARRHRTRDGWRGPRHPVPCAGLLDVAAAGRGAGPCHPTAERPGAASRFARPRAAPGHVGPVIWGPMI